ncbi:MAG: methylated-DNA--[Oscillospiraceae bacterium]|nr:methylated-DNA--[protein]-cysteine S-methyltransferase [Oscillospiraceae bacterium]
MVMDFAIINTPIGALRIVEEDGYITEIKYVCQIAEEVLPETDLLKEAANQLCEYFDGLRKEFTLPLNPKVSPYRRKVLEALMQVPFGSTVTYKDLAEKTGNPKAVRAVGSAMRTNPIIIAIPCHRVLKSDGSLGNYSAGGPANKDWLLTFEHQNTYGLWGLF